MKIAICSDEIYPINEFVVREVEGRGYEVVRFGALISGHDESWASAAKEAALAVSRQECHEGIFFCFTATGVTIAANKIPHIRAALCSDKETARLARIWNHANVLALANRTLLEKTAKEILEAWFETPCDERGKPGVMDLEAIDQEFRTHLYSSP